MKKTKVFLEGVLSKATVSDIKNEIEEVFTNYNLVDIEISNIVDIDEYFLQLCHHFKLKVQQQEEKSISFCLCNEEELANKIEKAGFIQLLEQKAS